MSREAKKRILEQAAQFLQQQEQGIVADATEESDGSEALWKDLIALKPTSVSFQEGSHEIIPCKPPTPKPSDSSSTNKYKWKTSLDEKFEFDFVRAMPYETIDKINWHQDVQGVQRSGMGSEGVYFVGFYGSSASVVVKGSRNMAAEVFANLLAGKLGLAMPLFRVISTGAKEGSAMLSAFRERDSHGLANASLGSQTHVMVKDFVRGVNLNLLSEQQLISIMGKDGNPNDIQKQRFSELARLLLLDILTNNGDRLPLIWDNRGNPGNTMFSRLDGQIIAIDNAIVTLSDEQKRSEYMEKVRDFVHLLQRNDKEGSEAPHFHCVRDKFIEYCSYDYGTPGSLLLQKCMLEEINSKDASFINQEELTIWKQHMESFEPKLVGLHNVDAQFVTSVWETLREQAEA
eukprot:m.75397 g.75397  ORF g.75397 m.75397 type:complete len:403 (-) comp8480_c1_seq3:60-1268(-)